MEWGMRVVPTELDDKELIDKGWSPVMVSPLWSWELCDCLSDSIWLTMLLKAKAELTFCSETGCLDSGLL
jgi:hypothetical protein